MIAPRHCRRMRRCPRRRAPSAYSSSPAGSSPSQKYALQVYVLDAVPTPLAGLDRAADFDDADIVVMDVDPAECQDASIDYRGNIVRAVHISSDRLADAAFHLDDPLGFERLIEVDIGCEDLCSFTGEEHRRRLAVAPARTTRACSRNQHDLLFEPIAHALLVWQSGSLARRWPCLGLNFCNGCGKRKFALSAARLSCPPYFQ